MVLPDGMTYRLLVLPLENAIDLEVLRKVESLVKEGLTVIGPRPSKATGLVNYPESDKVVKEIASRLWGSIDSVSIKENSYGKGRVIWGRDVNTVLAEMNVKPDLEFTSTQANTGLDYIHRTTNEMDIYFIMNRYGRKGINDFEYRYLTTLPDRYEQVECKFRVTGKVPELWDPMTGQVKEILIYREENGQTIVPLHMEPEGSVLVVFKDAPAEKHITAIQKDRKSFFPGNQFATKETPYISFDDNDGKRSVSVFVPGEYTLTWSDGKQEVVSAEKLPVEEDLSGKWDLHFDPKWGGPELVQIDTLKSWTRFEDQGIKYYSGNAVYKKTFQVSPDNMKGIKVVLDLGNVLEMASIKINGNKMAVRWCPPFQFDITRYVKEGDNRLEVEVVNLWPNRLIGDSKLPEEKRLTKTNVLKFTVADSEKYLRESGLLGRVRLMYINQN